jgi:hypothetical protein
MGIKAFEMAEPATVEQSAYVKCAKNYMEEAFGCARAEKPLWRLGVVALGSALESLLRLKYGRGPRDLFTLIDKFDNDPDWDGMQLHLGATRDCSTCHLEAIRKQRNSVHPDLWTDCSEKEFDAAAMAILLIQHMLIHCETRIAEFPKGIGFPDVFRQATEEEARFLAGV